MFASSFFHHNRPVGNVRLGWSLDIGWSLPFGQECSKHLMGQLHPKFHLISLSAPVCFHFHLMFW